MSRPKIHQPSKHLFLAALAAMAMVFIAAACTTEEPPPTPTPDDPVGVAPTPVPDPTPTPRIAPSPTPTAPPEEEQPLGLRVLAPQDGAGVEIRAVRILGTVRADAAVAVNGTPVSPAADGSFHRDVSLDAGVNYIEVSAADVAGVSQTEALAVFAVSPSSALPLSMFYPQDGIEVRQSTIPVVGGTRRDAVVGVNGVPAPVNAHGIFSVTVSLEPGWNSIEIVAADIDDHVNFQTLAVFYRP